ncbi:OmpH family outer membrane protein [Neptuniibacter sp. CAU 1671]|uniref:OmpH family outer membrane protein n=1 Tax=Neptuniibacter sp. CAU 1671 TaxID=3032593 RepID=UPI0023DA8AEF|nr:OmpH family outer membrane protein [Neptuniibacter sp. CAU 1671]MDF2181772.1 OmpH family outer membrane protein [Neptuniibacter sp. CAU 1671]
MKFKSLLVCLFTFSISVSAHAEKVAVLGVQEALLGSTAAETFRETLRKELASDEKQVLELEKQAKAIQEKLKKNKGLASEEEMQQMKLQFQKVFTQYQQAGQALQQKRMEKEQAFVTDMRPVLDKVIRGLIEEEKYDIVVAKEASVFARKGLDITPKVIELLNSSK